MIGLGFDVPFHETVAYKQIFEIGREKGREEGREKVLKALASMHADPEFVAKVLEMAKIT